MKCLCARKPLFLRCTILAWWLSSLTTNNVMSQNTNLFSTTEVQIKLCLKLLDEGRNWFTKKYIPVLVFKNVDSYWGWIELPTTPDCLLARVSSLVVIFCLENLTFCTEHSVSTVSFIDCSDFVLNTLDQRKFHSLCWTRHPFFLFNCTIPCFVSKSFCGNSLSWTSHLSSPTYRHHQVRQ